MDWTMDDQPIWLRTRKGCIRQLRRALQHILDHRDRVWVTRARDICAHMESLPAGIVPGSR
jgi:hypothetical protein